MDTLIIIARNLWFEADGYGVVSGCTQWKHVIIIVVVVTPNTNVTSA